MELSVGDMVRLRTKQGPVMLVEADKGHGNFTLSWFEGKRPRSWVLPGALVVKVEDEGENDPFEENRPTDEYTFDFRLVRSQRKKVFDLIVSEELHPADFRWLDVPSSITRSGLISRVEGPDGSFFNFERNEAEQFFGVYSPGPDQRVVRRLAPIPQWNNFNLVGEWLGVLRREVNIEDPWETFGGEQMSGQAPLFTADNSPLTSEEQAQIAESVEVIKQYVLQKADVGQELRSFLIDRFDELKRDSQKFGKRDWLNVALATFLQVAFLLGGQADVRREIFNFAVKSLEWLVQSGPRFLPMTSITQ